MLHQSPRTAWKYHSKTRRLTARFVREDLNFTQIQAPLTIPLKDVNVINENLEVFRYIRQ